MLNAHFAHELHCIKAEERMARAEHYRLSRQAMQKPRSTRTRRIFWLFHPRATLDVAIGEGE